ncbi:MAG: hypothetical protein ACYC0X_15110 [Pirellulaceae bacterium]
MTWNLTAGEAGEFLVTEIDESSLRTFRFLTCEGFAVSHFVDEQPRGTTTMQRRDFSMGCRIMDHGTPTRAHLARCDQRLMTCCRLP